MLITIESKRKGEDWKTVNSVGGPVRYSPAVAAHHLKLLKRCVPDEKFRLVKFPYIAFPECHDDIVFNGKHKLKLEKEAMRKVKEKV